ncbi:MAG: hypothetical protein ACYCU8_11150 [Ferrimicrobium acidiphilum]
MSKEYAKEMEAIKSKVMELAGRLAPGSLLSIGAGKEAITVRLKPNAAELAEKLKESFGATVDITVGCKKFPLDVHFASRLTLHPPQVVDALSILHASIAMTSTRLPSGTSTTGRTLIENMGNTCLLFDASAPVGWLSEPGGSVALGGHAGKIAASLQHMKLEPGAVGELSFIVGTADLGPSMSFLLSPGHYEVVVPVHVIMSSEHTEGVPRVIDLQVRDCYLSISDPLR